MSKQGSAAGSSDAALSGSESLDAIFRANVQRAPDALALVDPLDRTSFASGPERRLTYRQADAAIDRLAKRLSDLGLPRESRIALHFPNTVEAPIALLAAQRAGLAAALLPLSLSHEQAVGALRTVAPKALLVSDAHAGGERLCERVMHLAGELFSVRFVCGFGSALPDGIVRLDDIFDETHTPIAPAEKLTDSAIFTFDATRAAPLPVTRLPAQLLVSGLAVLLEAGVPRSATILSTVLLSSFAGLSCAFVPWLLSGGALALHHPFDAESFARQVNDLACDTLVVPEPLADDAFHCFGVRRPERAIALWRAAEGHASTPAWRHDEMLTDVLAFAETGLLALRREANGKPRKIPAGAVKVPARTTLGPTVMATFRSERGTLALSGPMLPAGTPIVDTGYPCDLDPVTNTFQISGPQLVTTDAATSHGPDPFHAPAA